MVSKPLRFCPQAFHLKAGGILITVPEDRLFDEMEQLVLSTKHLQELLDDFVLRQPSRRVTKVGDDSSDCTLSIRSIADVSTNFRRICSVSIPELGVWCVPQARSLSATSC